MDSNVINRLKEYCMKHQELMQSGVIKGINSNTNEIVLEKNGVQKNVSMDILENNKFDFDKFEIIPDMIEEDEEVETIEEMIEEPQETINVPKTMSDINEAIKNKDINKIMSFTNDNLDSPISVITMLKLMDKLGSKEKTVLNHSNSELILKKITEETTSYMTYLFY